MSAYREPTPSRVAEIVRTARVAAVIGMKDESDSGAPAFYVPRVMQSHGIRVIPVNPKLASSLGEKAIAAIGDLDAKVDVVQIFRRSDAIGPIADEILALPPALRPSVVWMQSGIVNVAAAEKMQDAGIEVVMDRCFKVDLASFGRDPAAAKK